MTFDRPPPGPIDPNTPVLVAWSAVEQRQPDHRTADDAVELMVRAARSLLSADLARTVLPVIDWVAASDGSTSPPEAPRLVADALGASGAHTVLAEVGVMQQTLLSRACRQVQDGGSQFALVVGGEARYRETRARAAGEPVPSQNAGGPCVPAPDEVLRPNARMVLSAEVEAGLAGAPGFYALLESQWRSRRGVTLDAHRDQLGVTYARFSEIAASNPHATRRQARSPNEIRNPSAENPMLAFPYTKWMATTWTVDQASALLFCTAETAGRYRVPRSKWLFPLVAVECNHVVPVSARANLTQPAAMACLSEAADRHLGFPPGGVDLMDLYSCFPVAVEAAAEGLGLGGDRDKTVTGGMSFAGGPYNNYVFQATARMADLLHGGAGACGLVSCVSGLYTKLGFTVLGVAAPSQPFSVHDVTAEVTRLEPAVPVDDPTAGTGTIAAYTVLYEHGEPERAVAVIDLANRHRAVGRSSHPEAIRALLAEEGVGRRVSLDNGVFSLGG